MKRTTKTMSQKNLLVLLVALFAIAMTVQSVSAQTRNLGQITVVEVNGIPVEELDFGQFAGETIELRIGFNVESQAPDVKVIARISGSGGSESESERFEAFPNRTYSRIVDLKIPSDLGEDLQEPRTLYVRIESEDGRYTEKAIPLEIQRRSYNIEILNVEMQSEVKAGGTLEIETVLKNIGYIKADDVFLRVRIPELGLETKTFFQDLYPNDNDYDEDRRDSKIGRTYLKIPSNVAPGLYTVQLEAFNGDSFAQLERRVLVVGAGRDSAVFPSSSAEQDLGVGERGEYKITIVNRGDSISAFQVIAEGPSSLNLEVSEPFVVIPAGLSKTVSVYASSDRENDYTFNVKVISEDGAEIGSQSFKAIVEGESKDQSSGQNTTVLLTVILAIVFIVLLVVLIVLLTRKPETKEEFGESYY